jgi:hypothetical protein
MKRILLGSILVISCAAVTAAAPITSIADASFTCSGGAQVITIPEDTTEASTTLTCPGFVLPASVAGTVAIFLDSPGVVSDFVTFANVNGAANFVFVSDVAEGPVVPPVGVPVLTTVTEPTPVIVVAASTSGGSALQFTFSSDTNESTTSSDTIGVAVVVPEPEPVSLIAVGTLLILCWHLIRRRRTVNG